MKVDYAPKALSDLQFWKMSGNKQIQKKIFDLIESIKVNPFEGIGQPEALKHNLSGFWSRRITWEDRMVYKVEDEVIRIHSLRRHYLL